MNDDRLISMRQASKLLSLTPTTLRSYDNVLQPLRTVGKQRRYRMSKINEFLGIGTIEEHDEVKPYAIYARVSSTTQKTRGDLQRQAERLQEYCDSNSYPVSYTIKDSGSGLNDLRRGFTYLTELVISKKIKAVVIEHKDRLSRFQFNFIKTMFKSHGCEIIVVDDTPMTDAEELTTDMMSLIASFSGKFYNKRRNRKNSKSESDIIS